MNMYNSQRLQNNSD